jgi:hypothetical protein
MTRGITWLLAGSAVVPDAARQAAIKSLHDFDNYTKSKRPNAPGGLVDSGTSLGQQFRDYIVGLDDLKQWDGKDPASVLHPTGRIVFQIHDKKSPDQVRASVTVVKAGDTWDYVSFGTSQEAKARSDARGFGNSAEMLQVRVPSLHASFVAQKVDGVLELTPIDSVPKLGIESGKTEAARDLFLRLQPTVQKLDPKKLN